MKPFWKTSNFQLRWAEPLGVSTCPYAVRYVLIFFGFSIRLHIWSRSDDKRFKHSHPWNFRTFVLKGHYYDVSEKDGVEIREKVSTTVYRKAEHLHYVEVPEDGCITLLFCSKPYQKWGFMVNGKFKRPLKYFHKFGHPPCDEQ